MLLPLALLSACQPANPADEQGDVQQEAQAVTGVRGAVGSIVVQNFAPFLSGWACEVGVAKSLSVHLYVNGPAGTGKMVKSVVANQPNEAALDTLCGTTGVPHRFLIPISADDVRKYGGGLLYVHGISASGGANRLLDHSGEQAFPRNLITGSIDGVVPTATGYAVNGWACDLGKAQSIQVHLYAGGAAGTGTIAAVATADRPTEPAVNAACKTPEGTPHRFSIPLGESAIASHGGKALYVHGIRVAGSESPTNGLLGRSGQLQAPAYFPLNWSTFKSRLSAGASLWEVPKHLRVTLNENVPNLPLLHVKGQLVCGNQDLALTARGILVDGPAALLECGTAAVPYTKRFSLTLVGPPSDPGFPDAHGCDEHAHSHPTGAQAVVAKCGGRLLLHGKAPNRTWTRLAATADTNATELVLTDAVDWAPGARIAIASTSFNGLEADEVEITSVDTTGKRLGFKPVVPQATPLKYKHLGAAQAYSNGKSGAEARSWVLSQRAEVALLSRNILIQGTEYDATDDLRNKKGGHVMVTSPLATQSGPLAQLDSVELVRMGRLSELGRYPIHWHRAGTTSGDYLKNASIHHSFQRCVVIHSSHQVLVQNNVCFDHYGHGYFLEDGNETKNEFRGNLGFVSRRPPMKVTGGVIEWNRGLLVTDNRETTSDRWSSPATFWISNPDNTFVGNVAAGSQGTGFWFSLANKVACDVDAMTTAVKSCRVLGPGEAPTASEQLVYPRNIPLGAFTQNGAHSSVVGVSTDGVAQGAVVTPCDANGVPLTKESNKCGDKATETSHYSPRDNSQPTGARVRPDYLRLALWRHTGSGFYFRGDAALVDESILAESVVGAFFDYNQTLRNSLVVGLGPQLANDEAAVAQVKNRRFFAARLYDGPFTLDNVHLAGHADRTFSFPSGNSYTVRSVAIGNVGGAQKAPTNQVRGLTLVDSSPPVDLTLTDATWPSGLRDADGSLTGMAGATLIPYDADNNPDGTPNINSYSECVALPAWFSRRCPPSMRFGSLTFFSTGYVVEPPNIPVQPIQLDRVRRTSGTDQLLARFPGRQNKVTLPAYAQGATYRYFAGVDDAFILTMPPFDAEATSKCPAGATCDLSFSLKYLRLGDRSPIVRLKLPANTSLVSVQGLGQLGSEAALETTPGYFLSADQRTLSMRLEANTVEPAILADAPFDAYASVVVRLKRNP